MAVTANHHATAAAVEILRAGGNAVDAAAAAQFVLNVVEPQSSGIGGGGFLLVYVAKTGRVHAVDGREEAPAAAAPGMFLGPDGLPQRFFPQRITGGNAVGVPGLVGALEKALRLFGNFGQLHGRPRGLARVLAPAIRLAEGGFTVSPRLAESLRRHARRLALFPATRAVFFGGNGETLAAGKRSASTSNRNFKGRQGPDSRTHLVSPAMAAAAAVTGHFIDVRKLVEEA